MRSSGDWIRQQIGFTFQTFDDDKKRRSKKLLTKPLSGTLDEHWAVLAANNMGGAGVFVTVNATDLKGQGRKERHRRASAVAGRRSRFRLECASAVRP